MKFFSSNYPHDFYFLFPYGLRIVNDFTRCLGDCSVYVFFYSNSDLHIEKYQLIPKPPLFRDNELLKHQLKKYITAVQSLRRDGPNAESKLCDVFFLLS